MKPKRQLFLARAAMTLLLTMLTTIGAWATGGTLAGTGTSSEPYVIADAADWATFVSWINNSNSTYADKCYKLDADITISSMAGTSSYKFKGTFDGNGHTINLNNLTSTGEFCAPFRYVEGATFKRIHTTGTVIAGSDTSKDKYRTGLVGESKGTTTITSCWNSVAITSQISGDGTHGGFVGVVNGGTLTITNCLFDGSISGADTHSNAGFVGWTGGNTTNITNCLMAGTISDNTTSGATFMRGNSNNTASNIKVNNSYYKTAHGTVQGSDASGISNDDLLTVLGDYWEISAGKVVPIMSANNLVTATISGVDSYYRHTGSEITPEPTVTAADGTVLIKNTDYTVEWSGDGKTEGTYTVVVTGTGDYTGSLSASYVVTQLPEGMHIDTSKNPGDEGYYYVNMPTTNTFDTAPVIDLTDIYKSGYGATSIMVYDDGGKGGSTTNGAEGNYSAGCNGYLKLKAPAGCKLQFSGGVMINSNANSTGANALYIYDGYSNNDNDAFPCAASNGYRFFYSYDYNKDYTYRPFPGSIFTMSNGNVSSGEELTLFFKSEANRATYPGFYMTVEIIAPAPHDITTGTVNNGSYTAKVAGVTTTEARQYDLVTLDITPDAGYVLTGVTVSDGENNLPVSGGTWYNTTATFTMPDKAVTVSATFTDIATAQAAGLSINMSSDWNTRTYATIPSGVTAFSIYDAAGPNATTEALGTILTVTLEDDMAMSVTGSTSFTSGHCSIYAGGNKLIFNGDAPSDAINCETPGNVLVVSASSHNTDVALNVTVISPYRELTAGEEDLKDLLNFSFSGDGVINEGGTYKAKAGTTVTLTMTPKESQYYYAYSVWACKPDNESVKYDVNWSGFLCPTATITMPLTDVKFWVKSVSLIDTPEEHPGLMIPKRGMVEVNVPSNLVKDHVNVYDFAGWEGDVSGHYGNYYNPDDGTLLLTAPEGKTFRLSSSSYIEAPKEKFLFIRNADNNEKLTTLGTSTDDASKVYASQTDLCNRIKIQFCTYAVIGGESPYKGVNLQLDIIDIPNSPVTLYDASANDLSDKKNKTYNVTISGRTLTKDGNWNTISLPFSMDAAQIAASSLAGATIKELDETNTSLNTSTGALTLAFTDATSIEAGKPYIVKWTDGSNITNPTFPGVTISSTTPTEVTSADQNVKFVGQYSPFNITTTNINEILYIASGNRIGYSSKTRELKSCRAHFWVQPNGTAAAARAINFDFGEGVTGVSLTPNSSPKGEGSEYFDLQGRKVTKPTKGLYIVNGKKVVVK